MRTTIASSAPVEDLPDPFLEVGLHVAVQAGVAVDDLLDLRERLVVVGRGIDADPVLAEVGADDLVGMQRLADVRAEVAHARDRAQLSAAAW